MDRQAERVYPDQASIRQFESRIDPLPTRGQVLLVMKDGSCDGVVSKRPNVQMSAMPMRAINARARLQRPDVPEGSRHVWLDQVVRVAHLDLSM